MGAVSLVLSGCGSSGIGASGASVVLPPAPPAAAVHSSLKSAATYGLLVADGEKLIDVPMGTSPAVKTAQQKALANVSTTPKNLFLRSDGTSSLVQRFRPFLTFPVNYAFFKLRGSEEPFEAYVPEGFYIPTHSGIFPQDFQNYSFAQRLDVEWTLPVPGTGLFPDIALANVPQINRGGEIPITVPSTDQVHFVIEQSGGNQVITLDGVGEIYNGPQKFIIPWVSSYSPGLHRLKITVDGQEVANDSYIQRQLMFERPFPNSTDVVAGDVAITNTFGWTTDGATINANLPLSSEFWTAGGSETAAQFAPKNFNNQVSFTLNTLRETITKSVQPLSIPSPSSLAKELVANKTLGYSVLAHAQGYADYKILGNGSVPGFKRLAMVSNVHQTPSPVAVDGNATFEFDVTPINFDEGVLNYGFGLGENLEEFRADNAGTVTTTATGWHVSIPWKATPLSSTSGYLNLAVSEASDSRKYATGEQSFQVSLEQNVEPKATVVLDSLLPEVVDITENQQLEVRATITSEGFRSPDYTWKLFVQTEQGVDLLTPVTGTGSQVSQNIDLSSLLGQEISQVKVKIEATVVETDCTDPNHVLAKSEEACKSATDDDDQLVAVQTRPVIQLELDKSMLPSNLTAPSSGLSTIPIKVTFHGIPGVRESQVTLKLLSQPGSGGHAHDDPSRPLGELAAVHSPTLAAGSSWSTTYTAPIVGGITLIQASVDAQPVQRTTRPIIVEIPDLVELPPRMVRPDGTPLPGSPPYVLTGSLPAHPQNHFATYDTVQRLQAIALLNRQTDQDVTKLDETRIVYYNDMSLPRGGLFDIGPPYGPFWHPSHHEHRRGNIADMQPGDFFLRRMIAILQGEIHDEGDHWHVRFPQQ